MIKKYYAFFLTCMEKLCIFSNPLNYDVYYHLVKFQLKTPPMHGEMKKTNCIRGQFERKPIVWGVK